MHFNGKTHGNAYIITFKVKPPVYVCACVRARAHTSTHTHTQTQTHMLHRSYHCWKQRVKISFGIFQISDIAFDLMSSVVPKCTHSKRIFRLGNSQKLGGSTVGYGGWMVEGIFVSARNCCTTSDVWLCALS
jgi:hypothetical protein